MRNPKRKSKAVKDLPGSAQEGPSSREATQAVWQPGADPIEEGETLQYDPTAYDCLHAFSLDWPCLSFDVLLDDLGGSRNSFPHTLYLAAGTQATAPGKNYIALVKLTNLSQGKHGSQAAPGSDDDLSESDDDDSSDPPQLHTRLFAHHGTVNRVRSVPQQPTLLASWGDGGQVQVWDTSAQVEDLVKGVGSAKPGQVGRGALKHLFSHSMEGYALDWSRMHVGRLATGDCASRIHVWEPTAGRWAVSDPYTGHTASVEDIQWSPSEPTVFASCSADKSIRIWDMRERRHSMLDVPAHEADCNVLSWNRLASFMLASGGDDGLLRVWDLRNFKTGAFVANIAYHRGPVTSVEWSPSESSMLATSSADGQLAVWDLALERDPEEEASLAATGSAQAPVDLPPQLLFVHSGQTQMKELHWHPQIPGMLISTAADGFNVFKPANV